MTKWKIRLTGQQNYLTLEVNPSGYSRNKQVEVSYEQLADGSQCRVVAPITFKKEEFQLVWAKVNQDQLDILTGFINHKVDIVDHLGDDANPVKAVIDGLEKQYLITGAPEQQYAIKLKVREV